MQSYSIRASTVPTATPTCSRCHRTPPSIACRCDSHLLYCRACYGEHIFEPGEHIPTPLPTGPRASLPATLPETPEFTGPGIACSKCYQAASKLCICQHPVLGLCEDCVEDHVNRLPDQDHIMLPASASPHLATTESVGRLRRRATQLGLAQDQLQSLCSAMDEADHSVLSMLDALVEKIEEVRANHTEKINEFKESLQRASEEAIEEVKNNIWLENYKGSSFLARLIFDYREDQREALMHLFKYSVDPKKALFEIEQASNMNLMLTDPGTEELKEQHTSLPIVNSTSLRMFDVVTKKETQYLSLTQPISINETSTWMLVGNKVVASGKMYPLSSAVYEIAVKTGHVKEKKPMTVARYFHAMVYYSRSKKYYVFGGTGGAPENFQTRCEVHDPLLEQWTFTTGSLREGRDCFNPVQMEDKYFIVGGRNAKSVELFSTTTELFTQTLLALPAATSTVAFREDADILILQRDKAIRWKPLGTDQKTVTVKDGLSMFSNTTPLRVGNELFILRCVNCCICTLTFGKTTDPVQCSKTPLIY